MARRFKGFKKVDAGEAELAHRKGQEVLCFDCDAQELYLLKKCNPNFSANLLLQPAKLFYIAEMDAPTIQIRVRKGTSDEQPK